MKRSRMFTSKISGSDTLCVSIQVKWWAWPILTFEVITKRLHTAWYRWPIVWLWEYPKICLGLMLRTARGT